MSAKREILSVPGAKRPHFFDGRLLSAADLRLDQNYLLELQRLTNRAAFGDGVVRGLTLTVSGAGTHLLVSPGIAVTPSGRIAELPDASDLDLTGCDGTWELRIEIVDRPCDPQPMPTRGVDAGYEQVFAQIQNVVNLTLGDASAQSTDPTPDAVWLGTIRVPIGKCQLLHRHHSCA